MNKLTLILSMLILAGCFHEPVSPIPIVEEPLLPSVEAIAETSEVAAIDQLQPAPPDVAELVRELADRDPQVRVEAAEQLGHLGLDAKDAIPALIQRLDDAEPRVRGTAAMAIGQILAQDWLDPSPRDRGPHVDAAVAALIKSLKDGNAVVRQMAALSLGDMGPDATAAVPALTEALDDANSSVQKAAETALQLITGKFPGSLK